ncbi:MAG: hypothetical protein L6R42_004441 [Xanthoria sp. 1 TBL-2021]|nr:MAG: hypothetical protein L6R42_004441 [Xanthoria sp. 1 TBL-2021]
MNTQDSDHHELAEEVETKLCAALEDQDFNSLRIDPLLQDYRALYEDLLLKNCEEALRTNIEDKLWDAHVRINGRFRKQLGYFRDLKGRRKPVEQRKAAKLYLRFLKTSQRFYRGYIQRLATYSRGIREITAIAQRFCLDGAPTISEDGTQTTPELQHALLQSCHRTLIHLGDLSRYRESELDAKDKKRNWGPAIGYYDLAIAINPSSGTPHNQLAIIARIEGNRTRTLYHLYRAQSAYEPYPTANDSLDVELKKLRESLKPADFAVDGSDHTGSPPMHIQRCFPLLHSCCFSAAVLQAYNKVEDGVLGILFKGLKECTLSTELVNKIVLSNIAADFVAGDRWQADPEEVQNEHAFKSIQRLNIRTFSSLLQTVVSDYRNRTQEGSKIDTVTSTVQRLLPSLRYYSAWLISRAALLSVHLGDSTMDRVVKDFWAIYADTMSLLLSAIKINDLPQLEYLLEEDVDIIGFRPLQEVQLQRKPSISEAFMRRIMHGDVGLTWVSSGVEMRCRIRDFLEDCLELAENDSVPINFLAEENRFTVEGDWIDSSQTKHPSTRPSNRFPCPDIESTTDGTASQEASKPILQKAVQMDDTFLTHESSNNMAPPFPISSTSDTPLTQSNVANETSYAIGDSTLTALNTLRQDQQRPKMGDAIQSEHNSTPQSQRVSHVSVKSTPSEISEMPDPTQAPREVKLPRLHPARIKQTLNHWQHHDGFLDDIDFNSPNVFPDSSDAIRRPNAVEPTPPNG